MLLHWTTTNCAFAMNTRLNNVTLWNLQVCCRTRHCLSNLSSCCLLMQKGSWRSVVLTNKCQPNSLTCSYQRRSIPARPVQSHSDCGLKVYHKSQVRRSLIHLYSHHWPRSSFHRRLRSPLLTHPFTRLLAAPKHIHRRGVQQSSHTQNTFYHPKKATKPTSPHKTT